MTNKEKFKEIFGIEPDCGPCTPYPCEENDCKYWEQCENELGCPCEGWWNWEFKEPTTKNDLGIDCISRQSVLDKIQRLIDAEQNNIDENGDYMNYARERVNAYEAIQFFVENDCLCPSVTPIRPKGHWILDETDNSITCDKCGCLIWANDISNGEAYFCPNCGSNNKSVSASDYYIAQGTEKS